MLDQILKTIKTIDEYNFENFRLVSNQKMLCFKLIDSEQNVYWNFEIAYLDSGPPSNNSLMLLNIFAWYSSLEQDLPSQEKINELNQYLPLGSLGILHQTKLLCFNYKYPHLNHKLETSILKTIMNLIFFSLQKLI